MRSKFLAIFCLINFAVAWGWDTEQLEIFDLVQDINKNFYDLIGVSQNATNQEIKRAFRTLSIQLHPDKNDAEDANEQFRNLVSVYEVLKDSSKREKYDKVLKDGLPNWKSALYYYRRMRKIGLMEGSLICFMIFTIGQYFFAWAAYLEKKYTAEEIFGSKLKKLQKKNKSLDIDNIISSQIPKPSILNTLPFQIPLFIWNLPKLTKTLFSQAKEFSEVTMEKRRLELEEIRKQKELQEELEKEREERKVKKENVRRRKQAQMAPERSEEELKGYSKLQLETISKGIVRPVSDKTVTATSGGGFWSDEDLVELVRLVKKYPGGTPSRWEVIGEQMHRSVNEITFMAAKLKENGYRIPGHSDNIAENTFQETVKKDKVKKQNNTLVVAEANWSQEQQAALEAALMKYKKTANVDRWQKIGNSVPGKTKEECLQRYKYLCDVIKQQKAQNDRAEEVVEEEPMPAEEIVQEEEELLEEVMETHQIAKKKSKRKERRKRRDFSSGEDSDDMYTYE